MSDTQFTSPEAFVERLAESTQESVEELAVEGGITADTRGNLTVEMLLRILRWRSAQSVAVFGEFAADPDPEFPEATLAFAWKAGVSSEHYEAATERLRSMGADVEPLEFAIHGDTLGYMREQSSTAERVAVGLFAAPKLRIVKDKQTLMVAEANADLRTMGLYRETIVEDEQAALDRGVDLLTRILETDPGHAEAVAATAEEFLEIAHESQEQAMDEAGEIDPKSIC